MLMNKALITKVTHSHNCFCVINLSQSNTCLVFFHLLKSNTCVKRNITLFILTDPLLVDLLTEFLDYQQEFLCGRQR